MRGIRIQLLCELKNVDSVTVWIDLTHTLHCSKQSENTHISHRLGTYHPGTLNWGTVHVRTL